MLKLDLSRAHDPVAVEARLRRLERDQEIHIHHLGMASRRITADYPELAGWFCLRLRGSRECSVEKTLTDADVETIFPVIKIEERKVRGRLFHAYSKPVMPGYMLVRIVPSPGAFAGLSEVRDVVGIVGNLAMPHRVSDKIAKRFKWMETANTIATEPSKVTFADKEVVRVVEGPFAGMIGKMTRAYDEGDVQGRIMLASYGNILPVTLPLAFLKKM